MNLLNANFERFSNILKVLLENETFENGIVGKSEQYFDDCYREDSIQSMLILSKLFTDEFTKEWYGSNNIIIGILHILSHKTYSIIYPIGQMIAISALCIENDEICDYTIKCFENWEHTDGIEVLRAKEFQAWWLETYRIEVLDHLCELRENKLEGKDV
jgi:hypothetical protein